MFLVCIHKCTIYFCFLKVFSAFARVVLSLGPHDHLELHTKIHSLSLILIYIMVQDVYIYCLGLSLL